MTIFFIIFSFSFCVASTWFGWIPHWCKAICKYYNIICTSRMQSLKWYSTVLELSTHSTSYSNTYPWTFIYPIGQPVVSKYLNNRIYKMNKNNHNYYTDSSCCHGIAIYRKHCHRIWLYLFFCWAPFYNIISWSTKSNISINFHWCFFLIYSRGTDCQT